MMTTSVLYSLGLAAMLWLALPLRMMRSLGLAVLVLLGRITLLSIPVAGLSTVWFGDQLFGAAAIAERLPLGWGTYAELLPELGWVVLLSGLAVTVGLPVQALLESIRRWSSMSDEVARLTSTLSALRAELAHRPVASVPTSSGPKGDAPTVIRRVFRALISDAEAASRAPSPKRTRRLSEAIEG